MDGHTVLKEILADIQNKIEDGSPNIDDTTS